MKIKYKEGDLFTVIRSGSLTLCKADRTMPPSLRECPVEEFAIDVNPPDPNFQDYFENLEGKVGLIVYVRRNKLLQPLGYRVLIEGHELFCKYKVATQYFKPVENQGDESR
jgi:hypothetical protein